MKRVLIAEDSPTQAKALELTLSAAGYDVVHEPDGEAALLHLDREPFDLVLSDVQMPKLNGYELCGAMKQSAHLCRVPVMLLTRLNETLDIVRGLASGADNFITKPWEEEHLLSRVAALQPPSDLDFALEEAVAIECMGEYFNIHARREQMLNFLMSTFDEFVRSKQRELKTQLTSERQRREELGDLTQELQTLNARLTRLANVDPLTEVLNRRGLDRALTIEMNRSQRTRIPMVAALADLDDFKRINDQLGHAVGDVVLAETAKRLELSLRPTDRVGRVGGDEFLILLPDTEPPEAQHVADRVRLAVAGSPLVVFSDLIHITTSIGTAILPFETCSIEEVLTLTRQGLRDAKTGGGNKVSITELAGDIEFARESDVRNGVKHGPNGSSIDSIQRLLLQDNSFRAVSQPIFHLHDESLAGYELLSRGPEGAYEMPNDFFRICLEGNFLTSVDLQCLKKCVAATAGLTPAEGAQSRFHVNLFPSTLLDTPPERLIPLLAPTDSGVFCVEMSEQQFISDPACLLDHVQAFQESGILVAMDDVGFGRSSLEALVLLEPDLIKIDPRYVAGISHDDAKARSIQRLVKVAESLDSEMVAEGIEIPEDLEMLRTMGVSYGQGFYWGRPA